MATMLTRDIDWALYGIPDPAHTDAEWDAAAFRDAVGGAPCTLYVDDRDGRGHIRWQWRIDIGVSAAVAARLRDEVFTAPFNHRYAVYALFPRTWREYRLPELP